MLGVHTFWRTRVRRSAALRRFWSLGDCENRTVRCALVMDVSVGVTPESRKATSV